MELEKLNVGFVTMVSGRWPVELPEKRHNEYSKWIFKVFKNINLIKLDKPAVNNKDVQDVTSVFKKEGADIVIFLIGAFTGDYAATYLAEELRVPLIIWAPREPLFDGGRLMANSLVAATMNAAALNRTGSPCHFVYGNHTEKRVEKQISNYIKVYDCIKKLRSTYLGLFGYRPTGFYSSTFDETLIRQKFGIRMEEFDLKLLLDRAEGMDAKLVEQDSKSIERTVDSVDLPEGYLNNHSRLYMAMNEFIEEQGFNAISLKCWPELGQLRYTPCAVLSRFADKGFIIGCESDVDTTITMLIQKYLTQKVTFMCDLISIDEDKNTALLWHCGQAAASLKDPNSELLLSNHPLAGQGAVFESTLKPGNVTIARMSKIGGVYKLFIANGTAIPTKKAVKGVMVNVRFDTPVLDMIYRIVEEGVPHHYSVVWENVAEDMKLLCKILDIEVIIL